MSAKDLVYMHRRFVLLSYKRYSKVEILIHRNMSPSWHSGEGEARKPYPEEIRIIYKPENCEIMKY